MKTGLTMQVALLAMQSRADEIKVQTLEESGKWFRHHFPITPPTSVVALDDWKHQNRKTVWYDSRFYRLNVLWENGGFFIRDLHLFDENVVSPTHYTALATTSLAYGTLPVMDGALWSGNIKAGIWPVLLAPDGSTSPLTPDGSPVVTELDATDLSIRQPLHGGGALTVVCGEARVTFTAVDGQGQPLPWAWDLVGGTQQKSVVVDVAPQSITYRYSGATYQLRLAPDTGLSEQLTNGTIRLHPNHAGTLALVFGGS